MLLAVLVVSQAPPRSTRAFKCYVADGYFKSINTCMATICRVAYREGAISAARFPSYVTKTSIALKTTSFSQLKQAARIFNLRIETIGQRTVLRLLLYKAQIKQEHYLNKPIQPCSIVRFYDLIVDLPMSYSETGAFNGLQVLTGRSGGEMMRLSKGANSSRKTCCSSRCRRWGGRVLVVPSD